MLRRFASKAVLCYDPDAAGQGAAERSCELLVSEGFDVNVALLPGGEDPDTFVQKRGREAYVAQLKQSRPYLEFLLDRAARRPRPDPRRSAPGVSEARCWRSPRGFPTRRLAISSPIAWPTRRG